MQFYRFEGFTLEEPTEEEKKDHRISREKARRVFMAAKTFNQPRRSDAYLFVSDAADDTVTAGIILKRPADVNNLITGFLRAIGIDLKDCHWEETTFSDIRDMLKCSYRNGYGPDDTEILIFYELDRLCGNVLCRDLEFSENILEERDKRAIYRDSEKLFAREFFLPELDRIYAGRAMKRASGHPVHYMIQTDDRETRKIMCRLLLQALYANHRLQNKRYTFLDIQFDDDVPSLAYGCLYKACIGGTVIVRYTPNGENDDHCTNGSLDTVKTLCDIARQYGNQVLTLFCFPRECTKVKDLFYENLGSTGIVELKEEFVSGERAEQFLKALAKDNHVSTDKKLFARLEDGKGYLAPDLRALFDEWYNAKLKTAIFPQYKDIVSARKETIKASPKGSAYEELNAMIGLDEAKKVIRLALNYYKAQKIFADKGIKSDHPSMHMVFTGNPGTAKTSAARLFSRIMRENGLLSKGDLIEVGRGDLVGKYVGWTATIVKKKFEEAKGSVLFIDEAYSLVDNKNGSFGDEAINTIVQEMENHRDDVVVIFAGYPDKMEAFLEKNPGLRSRIAYHVPFSDYDTDSLCRIAHLIASQKGVTLSPDACEKLMVLFDQARKESDFGNGRYVRNVIEKARMAQATRLLSMDYDAVKKSDVTTILAEDIEIPQKRTEKKRIGFCA